MHVRVSTPLRGHAKLPYDLLVRPLEMVESFGASGHLIMPRQCRMQQVLREQLW